MGSFIDENCSPYQNKRRLIRGRKNFLLKREESSPVLTRLRRWTSSGKKIAIAWEVVVNRRWNFRRERREQRDQKSSERARESLRDSWEKQREEAERSYFHQFIHNLLLFCFEHKGLYIDFITNTNNWYCSWWFLFLNLTVGLLTKSEAILRLSSSSFLISSSTKSYGR